MSSETRAPSAASEAEEQRFLGELGRLVRDARGQRGLSRRALAGCAGVSERYLAQLETGRGNVSVLLLRRIANALGLELATLLLHGPAAPALRDMVTSLRGAPEEVRARALASASAQLGTPSSQPRGHRQGVALLGLRGAGKSTLGRLAAQRLRVPFVELDQRIAEASGFGIPEIFNLYGADAFRRFERRCLEAVIQERRKVVLATGGGIVSEADTVQRLLEGFFTVWIRATPEEHMQRVRAQGDTRPMSGSEDAMDTLRTILSRREARYARADRQLDTSSRSVENCARDLVTMLREAGFEDPGEH